MVLALIALAAPAWWMRYGPAPHLHPHPHPQADILDESDFSWHKITPSTSLEYTPCFNGYQCARLTVPMDYHRPSSPSPPIAIALTRLPAKVPPTDPRYGGAILINPGGPGGSGVAQALRWGHNLQTVADSEFDPVEDTGHDDLTHVYFDIIGFDPRGVNNTTPGFSCFPDLFSQKTWEIQREADGMLGSSARAFARNWDRTVARNIGCSGTLATPTVEGGDALGEHVNTVPVARDMLEIVERHGEWRERVGREEQRRRDREVGFDADQRILRRTKWKRGKEKLLYWGRSYGTVLGTTFAAMWPDRVERVVLDGVVDAQRYYHSEGPNPIVDADAIFDRFAVYCDTVGAESCPLHVDGGVDAIKLAYYELENSMHNVSIPVPATKARGPELVTWTDLKTILRVAVYQPLAVFPLFAKYASDMSRGDGSAFADFKSGMRSPSCPSSECRQAGPWSAECRVPGESEVDSGVAILCSDADYLPGLDEEGFFQRWESLRATSSAIGDYWASIELDCVRWNVTPKWRFPGLVSGQTSHPLLFVNNLLDPVTPLISALKMSERFPGSVVLRQDSEGHTTLAAPSFCTTSAIRTYFQTGELPPIGTLCQGDLKPFLGAPDRVDTMEDLRQAVQRRQPLGL